MAKKTITTNLLGADVIIGPETGTYGGPKTSHAGQLAKIRSAYLDKDGDPKYTLEVSNGGELTDLYPCHFKIVHSLGTV